MRLPPLLFGLALSSTAIAANIQRNATLVEELLKKRGFRTQQLANSAGRPAVFAEFTRRSAGAKTVLLYIHMDGQPVIPAQWAMGRALWLRGDEEQSLVELERAVDLSPNYAVGHYTLSIVHSQTGDPHTAIRASDYSRQLSPFDPLLFAMLASRALALMRLGQFEEATNWSVSAASRPNAHVHVRAIAAHCLAAAGRLDDARTAQVLSTSGSR